MAAWYDPRDKRKRERDWPWVFLLICEVAAFLAIVHWNIHA